MAIYRQIHISFWQDPYVLRLKPTEKYFYLYLMTNSKTSQCGAYEITKQIIQLETGFNLTKINSLLKKFISDEKIDYDENFGVIFIRNWLKYNFSSSPKVKARIEIERKAIKSPELKGKLDTVLIQYGYSMDTQTQSEVKVKVKEEEEPEVKVKEKTAALLPTFLSSTSLPDFNKSFFTEFNFYFPINYQDILHVKNKIEKLFNDYCITPDKSVLTRFSNIITGTKGVKHQTAFNFLCKISKEFKSLSPERQNFAYLSSALEGKLKDALDAARKKEDVVNPLNGNGLKVIQEAAEKLSIK